MLRVLSLLEIDGSAFRKVSVFAVLMMSVACQADSLPAVAEIVATKDPVTVTRGQYLVYGPAGCARCHTDRALQTRLLKGEILPLSGGRHWKTSVADVYAANLTSHAQTGLGNWSDNEIALAIRFGLHRDGSILFPMMEYADITQEDLTAIVSYLRSLPATDYAVPDTQWTSFGRIVRSFVLKLQKPKGPVRQDIARDTSVEYGAYLAKVLSHCVACHTPRSQRTGRFIGAPLSGGTRFPSEMHPGKVIVPPNLTPDPETGVMAKWTEEQFLQRMQSGIGLPGSHMPWGAFSRTDKDDLKAIFNYLKSVPAIRHDPGPSLQSAP